MLSSGTGMGLELLAGAIGGIAVFVLGTARDVVRSYLGRRQETIALMTLVQYEVLQAEETLKGLSASSLLRTDTPIPLRLDAWKGSRERVSQLVSSRAAGYLDMFYTNLENI